MVFHAPFLSARGARQNCFASPPQFVKLGGMQRVVCLLCRVLAMSWVAWSAHGAELSFNFGDEPEGTTPTNFLTVLRGGGAPPVWKIVAAQVPSGFEAFGSKTPLLNSGTVLAQTSQDPTDERYPMLIYTGEKFADFTLDTRFEAVSGVAEQMAGVVFRYQNSSNFYVVRVSVLGKNIAFYKVVNGDLVSPVKLPLPISTGTWHELKVDCSGIYIECFVDGQKVLPTITDSTAAQPDGLIGFWTKSDAVTYFADATLTYTPRIPAAQQIVDEIVAGRPKLLGLQIYTQTGTNLPTILASKDPAEIGKPGSNAEVLAIQSGTVSLGFDHGNVLVTMPLHDRNGEFIAAMRVKMKSFFGETQDNAVTRAHMVQHDLETYCTSADNLRN
jgi:hypothetical protein